MRVDLLSRIPEASVPTPSAPARAAPGSFAAAVAEGAAGWLGWALPQSSAIGPRRPTPSAPSHASKTRAPRAPKSKTRDPRPGPAARRAAPPPPPPPPAPLALVVAPLPAAPLPSAPQQPHDLPAGLTSAASPAVQDGWLMPVGAKRARSPTTSRVAPPSTFMLLSNPYSALTVPEGAPPADDGAAPMHT